MPLSAKKPAAASARRLRVDGGRDSRSTRILEVVQAGVIALDGAGFVLECNPFACAILGVDVGDVLGLPIEQCIASVAELRRRTGKDGRGEIAYTRPDGRTLTLGFGFSELEALPDAVGLVLLFQDVSALAGLRRERDRLLQMAAVGEVLPAMLHELRNPLAAVMTMLELLVEEASGHLQHDLHTVLAEVRRLILSLQGIGGFRGEIASAHHQAIDEAIEEAVEILQPTAARRSLTLTAAVETMPLLPLAREAIKGVVFNLVRNAIDACGPGQSVEVRARLTREGWLELVVIDTGKGMEEEVLQHCTELFFTDKESGSGIGLAICRQVAERAHGELSIVSAKGTGTTVTLRVPARTRGGTTCHESTV